MPELGGFVLVVCARQLATALTVAPRWLVKTADTENRPPDAFSSTPLSDAAAACAIAAVLNGPSTYTTAFVTGCMADHSLACTSPAANKFAAVRHETGLSNALVEGFGEAPVLVDVLGGVVAFVVVLGGAAGFVDVMTDVEAVVAGDSELTELVLLVAEAVDVVSVLDAVAVRVVVFAGALLVTAVVVGVVVMTMTAAAVLELELAAPQPARATAPAVRTPIINQSLIDVSDDGAARRSAPRRSLRASGADRPGLRPRTASRSR